MILPIPGLLQPLLLLPAGLNYFVAFCIPFLWIVVLCIPSNPEGVLWWILAVFDHAMAIDMLKTPLIALLYANLRATTPDEEAADPGLYLARVSSGVALAALLVVTVVTVLGRTLLFLLTALKLLAIMQAGCWISACTNLLQSKGGIALMPGALQHLLGSTPRELLSSALRGRDEAAAHEGHAAPTAAPVRWLSVGELLWATRALTPVVLAPEEHREEALGLLPPRLLAALEQPLYQHLSLSTRQFMEPWSETAALRPSKLGGGDSARAEGNGASAHATGAGVGAAPVALNGPESARTSSPSKVVPPLRLPPRAPPNEAPDGLGTPRSTTSSTSTYSSMQVAAEAVAPELLLVRIATQGLKRLAMRKVADYRKLAECTASYAYETVCDVILAGPRWIRSLLSRGARSQGDPPGKRSDVISGAISGAISGVISGGPHPGPALSTAGAGAASSPYAREPTDLPGLRQRASRGEGIVTNGS